MADLLKDLEGFDWDDGNLRKNWPTHGVTDAECEEMFFNIPLVIGSDPRHSTAEKRMAALGRTDSDRWLFAAFTLRENRIRIIPARDMTQSERRKYEEKAKRDSTI